MAVAESKVLSAAGGKLASLWNGVHKRDREDFGCRFVRKAMRRLERGYDPADVMDDATKYEPRARDWTGFLEFVKGLVEIFGQLAPLFIK